MYMSTSDSTLLCGDMVVGESKHSVSFSLNKLPNVFLFLQEVHKLLRTAEDVQDLKC